MERALKRVGAIKQGNPLDKGGMIGAQASSRPTARFLFHQSGGCCDGSTPCAFLKASS
jgi:aldehyde dehydrogenase